MKKNQLIIPAHGVRAQQRIAGRMGGRPHGRTRARTRERTNARTNTRTHERTHERTNAHVAAAARRDARAARPKVDAVGWQQQRLRTSMMAGLLLLIIFATAYSSFPSFSSPNQLLQQLHGVGPPLHQRLIVQTSKALPDLGPSRAGHRRRHGGARERAHRHLYGGQGHQEVVQHGRVEGGARSSLCASSARRARLGASSRGAGAGTGCPTRRRRRRRWAA